MAPRGLERRLERLVERTVSRLFRSFAHPVEFGLELQRAMVAQRVVSATGQKVVPNWYRFGVAPDDMAHLTDMLGNLLRELAELAREHAREEGLVFVGPVAVEAEVNPSLRTGQLEVEARMVEDHGGRPPGTLLLPNGDRVPLGQKVVTLGRSPNSTVVLADPKASRHHAEILLDGDGYTLVDLGSANGTRVNGARLTKCHLVDGDQIRFGDINIQFEASWERPPHGREHAEGKNSWA